MIYRQRYKKLCWIIANGVLKYCGQVIRQESDWEISLSLKHYTWLHLRRFNKSNIADGEHKRWQLVCLSAGRGTCRVSIVWNQYLFHSSKYSLPPSLSLVQQFQSHIFQWMYKLPQAEIKKKNVPFIFFMVLDYYMTFLLISHL